MARFLSQTFAGGLILKLLPESFKDICEKQGLKLADGKEAIDGKIQYTINITKKEPLTVEYHVAYPLITDGTKGHKGYTQEVGTINLTFRTEYKTTQKEARGNVLNIFTGGDLVGHLVRTYELQSIEDLKIEISEKQKQEIEDDQFTV